MEIKKTPLLYRDIQEASPQICNYTKPRCIAQKYTIHIKPICIIFKSVYSIDIKVGVPC